MPLSIPDLSKLIRVAGEKLIEREEDAANAHIKKSGDYYDEAAKTYRSGHAEHWPAADRAREKGDQESKLAADIDKEIEGKKEVLAVVNDVLKEAQKG